MTVQSAPARRAARRTGFAGERLSPAPRERGRTFAAGGITRCGTRTPVPPGGGGRRACAPSRSTRRAHRRAIDARPRQHRHSLDRAADDQAPARTVPPMPSCSARRGISGRTRVGQATPMFSAGRGAGFGGSRAGGAAGTATGVAVRAAASASSRRSVAALRPAAALPRAAARRPAAAVLAPAAGRPTAVSAGTAAAGAPGSSHRARRRLRAAGAPTARRRALQPRTPSAQQHCAGGTRRRLRCLTDVSLAARRTEDRRRHCANCSAPTMPIFVSPWRFVAASTPAKTS